MRTLSEHEDFYARICHVAEKLLDKIEAKVDSGEPMSLEVAGCLSKAVSNMMKAEAKAIMGMREHHDDHEYHEHL
jgi:hypothetical protein